ncbi:hypothetical protein [Aureibacillus halotolerans]|uniref:Uncharacterized protein n=1 Tax=Aureibacillus halotolerans TaxID=1508390 RepID=A0A4R6TSL1_9BACI|nr:hypothetical protein [Aureibacillus halotolerans]TDQ36610.1 hypothetical protein EV213_11774 [Aureibacillus halotolerans]
MKRIVIIFLLAVVATGCVHNGTESISITASKAYKLIESDPSANFFFLNDRPYVRNEGIEVGPEQVGDLAGEIESIYSKDQKLKDLMSTKLPVGTEIYHVKNDNTVDQMIVKENANFIMYTTLVEG